MTSKTLSPEFLEEEFKARGVTYRLRELSIGEYDELVRRCTSKRPGPLGEEEVVDNGALLKMMVLKCSVEPKLTPESLASLPMRLVMKLNATVNRMHYGDEPEPKADDEASDGADEGAAKGND